MNSGLLYRFFTTVLIGGCWFLATGAVFAAASQDAPPAQSAAPMESTGPASEDIVTIQSPEGITSRQGLPYFVGISERTAGAKGISMNLVIIPPGGAAKPHLHQGYETAIYVLKGRVETRYGRGLRQSVINEAGDFVYIPPDLPHQPRNLSQTEPAMAIVSRNDPNEQEHVVTYDPAAEQ
jgi:uncharacterized RmlC-like cupin family protein